MNLSKLIMAIAGVLIVIAVGECFVMGAQFVSGNYPDAELHNIPSGDMKLMGLVMMAFTLVPLLIGILLILSPFLGTFGNNLKKKGVLYWAEVINIEHIENVSLRSGAIPCRVECGCYDENGLYRTFLSKLVTGIPDRLNIGAYVAVYAHPKKINKYLVDVSQIKTTLD